MALTYATVRAYYTADRTMFVHQDDPQAAFLAYPVGQVVKDDEVEAYLAFLEEPHPTTGQAPDQGAVAMYRVWRTQEGGLVHDGDPRAQSVAYEVGARLSEEDRLAYEELGAPPVKATRPSGHKMRQPGANKTAAPAEDGQGAGE